MGVLLITSGLVHLGVWALLGGTWEGAVSWRKPILFGISAGLTALSLGWVLRCVRPSWTDAIVAPGVAICLLAEVGLITLQQWRGVASHFNRETPLDAAITTAIGWLIIPVVVFVLDLTRRTWASLDLRPDLALAARGGMLLLAVACGIGFWTSWVGERQVVQGMSAETFGSAGVPKFPHGMPMHALQWLPLTALLLARWGVSESRRVRAVGWTLAGTVLVTLYSLLQTLNGRARWDWTAETGFLLLLAAGCLLAAWLPALRGVGARLLSFTLQAVQRDAR